MSASVQRGISHSGGPRAGSGNGTRSRYSFEEGGHRGGPSRDRESGFYSRSFIGPIIDLTLLSHETQVQDAYYQASRVSNQVRGLVCDDRSKRRLLPFINYSSTPEVPKVCFQGQIIPILGSSFRPSTLTPHFHEVGGCSSGSLVTLGHPHTELHRWLVDSSSIRAVSSSASRCRSRSHERLGVKAKCKEKCASSSIEDHLSGCGVGFDQDAGTSVSCSQESERRPVTHCEDFFKAVGSDGSCVQCDNFWPAAPETWWVRVVAQDHTVFPKWQPISRDQGHAAMLMCLRHVEETLVPVTRPCVGGSMSLRDANKGRLSHRLRSGHEWPKVCGKVSSSTLNVCMAAIAAFHSPVSDQSLGRNTIYPGYQEAEAFSTPKNAYLGFGCGFRGPFESSFWTTGRGSFEISYSLM